MIDPTEIERYDAPLSWIEVAANVFVKIVVSVALAFIVGAMMLDGITSLISFF